MNEVLFWICVRVHISAHSAVNAGVWYRKRVKAIRVLHVVTITMWTFFYTFNQYHPSIHHVHTHYREECGESYSTDELSPTMNLENLFYLGTIFHFQIGLWTIHHTLPYWFDRCVPPHHKCKRYSSYIDKCLAICESTHI